MHNTDILLNDFVIRSFRDVADCDYIAARLSFRAQLVQQFLWQSLQAIEKYLKCILVLNRIKAPRSHDLSKLLVASEQLKKFKVLLPEGTKNFLQYLDTAVWELRRYARVLDYNVQLLGGTEINLLALELKKNERAKTKAPQEFSIMGGHLEKVLAKSDHPSRAGLVWHNLKFGKRRRTSVSYTRTSMSGNSPLSLHPEILDEVLKYVFLSKDVVEAYRNAV
jgi:HEPN domain-containing protein